MYNRLTDDRHQVIQKAYLALMIHVKFKFNQMFLRKAILLIFQ